MGQKITGSINIGKFITLIIQTRSKVTITYRSFKMLLKVMPSFLIVKELVGKGFTKLFNGRIKD